MIFSDERAICINTGASCCISNSKEDFLTFAPSSSSVLQGIGSGISIAGTGTIKWCILNDNGDEVDLHLHNSLYVPGAPMCLLGPQHIAQQIALLSDGFHSKGRFGTLIFGGFHHIIPYNSTNNLPILFLVTDFLKASSSNIAPYTGTTPAALISSTHSFNVSTSNITSSQHKLLHLHQNSVIYIYKRFKTSPKLEFLAHLQSILALVTLLFVKLAFMANTIIPSLLHLLLLVFLMPYI
jgi:hypothetical protein